MTPTIDSARFVFAMLSATLLLAGSVLFFPLTATAQGSTAAASGTGVSLTLSEVTPWLDDKGTLTVRGTVTNSTDEAITAPRLQLGMSLRNLDAEHRIRAWKSDPSQYRVIADLAENGPEARKQAEEADRSDADDEPLTAADATFETELGPGSTGEFTITVPAGRLGLPTSSPDTSWGPRGLAVQVSDASGALATDVGFTTWYPNPKFDPSALSLLAPVTLPGYTVGGLIGAEELDEAIGDGGALSHIAKVLTNPAVSIALDPRVIASFDAALAEPDDGEDQPAETGAPEPPTTEPETTAPSQASDDQSDEAGTDSPEERTARRERLETWYRDFLETAKSRTVIALPYGDPDQTSLTGEELNDLGRFAHEEKSLVTDVLPEAKTDIAWPIAGSADRADLRALTQAGDSTVILDDVQQPPASGIRENGRSTTATSADGSSRVETLISDSALANQSAAAIGAKNPASAMSELVATSAAIQSEAPYRSRHLLLPLPRTTASAGWSSTVSTLSGLPWVETTDLDDLLSSDPEPRGPLQQTQDQGRIPTSTLSGISDIRAQESRFNSAFSDPAAANRTMDRSLLACTSVAWTLGGNSATCLRKAQATSREQMDSLYLEKGSSVLLVTGEKTTIPVTIVNTSTAEATLRLRMSPQTPALRAQTTETVVVPPAETMRVDVPVEGLANADVPTRIEMVTADDVVLPKDESLLVRVRADWENIGTAVIGLALAAVFVIGLVKSVSRGRRKIPEQQLAAAVARAKNDEPKES